MSVRFPLGVPCVTYPVGIVYAGVLKLFFVQLPLRVPRFT